MVRYRRRRRRDGFRPLFDLDFEDVDDTPDPDWPDAIWLNPFQTTYYLGRGRFGDNSRLHRGLMIVRERDIYADVETAGGGFSGFYDGYMGWWRRRRRGRREGYERR
jgi:hypothetical protein